VVVYVKKLKGIIFTFISIYVYGAFIQI
jgi:hypothetical protein